MARLERYDGGNTDAVGMCESVQVRVAVNVSECIRRGVSDSDTHAVLKLEGEIVS